MTRPLWAALLMSLAIALNVNAQDLVFQDDFAGGLNQPWVFLDNLGNVPPDFTDVSFGDADENLKFVGSESAFLDSDGFELSLSTTGYVGLNDDDYFFADEVHVRATFAPLENITLSGGAAETANNDVYVVARGDGLSGYIFALDAFHGEADLVRVDEGTVEGLGDDAILRGLPTDPEGIYTLEISAIDNLLTGRLYDEDMELLGEVEVVEDTYESGWAGLGAAINDGGDQAGRTLIAQAFDNFSAANTIDINTEPPTIDELTAAVRAGETDARFDIDDNGTVDADDRLAWIRDLNNTYVGDADLNGEFNSGDFVVVFTAGEYEDAVADNSLWNEGDWDGDGDFTSSDFVFAFSDGGYEQGPRTATSAVPEPAAHLLSLVGMAAVVARTRRTRSRCPCLRS